MPTLHPLLARLDAIAGALQRHAAVRALIALGSVGRDTGRLDGWSDLDFFVVVDPGAKADLLDGLDWLASAQPLAWHFRNTVDGHKALMTDGVFCEFAVFEPDELAAVPFAPGRLVWRRADVPATIAVPQRPLPPGQPPDETWIVGEALSNLLVGLQRWRRGERLSACRLVQGHAVDRLLELDALRQGAVDDGADPFSRERRIESRRPALAAELPVLVPGYGHTPAAALAMLAALARRGAVLAPPVVDRIRALAG